MAAEKIRRRNRSIRCRLTKAGWLFLGLSVLVGAAAVKSQTPMVFLIFGGMMGSLQVSAMVSRRSVCDVQLLREAPGRAWQNQTVHFGYHLRNSRRRPCLGLCIEEILPEGIDSVLGYCLHLPGKGVFRAGARFAARRRGRILLKDLRLKSTFPFGLVCASRPVEQDASLVVWPAKGKLKKELLHRGAGATSSAAPSLASGGQDEFFGLREYRQGDNLRWIHWRTIRWKPDPG